MNSASMRSSSTWTKLPGTSPSQPLGHDGGPACRPVVLLVDDEPDMVRMLAEALDDAGFTVLVATDGESALKRLARVTPDAVLLDARMPGMDGFETCRRLKQAEGMESVPVIFMTGLAETERIVEGLDAGGIDYLVKPVAPDELVARLRAHLRVAREHGDALRALELTGLAIACFDPAGVPLWSTPNARRLLADAPLQVLGRALAAWSGVSAPCESLPIDIGGDPYTLRPLGTSSAGGMLIRFDPGRPDPRGPASRPALTNRELDVLEWVARGKTNRDIGEILGMSPRTVNKHLEHAFEKLGVETRTAAVAQFQRLGFPARRG